MLDCDGIDENADLSAIYVFKNMCSLLQIFSFSTTRWQKIRVFVSFFLTNIITRIFFIAVRNPESFFYQDYKQEFKIFVGGYYLFLSCY